MDEEKNNMGDDMTPDEKEFLIRFASNGVAGRRMLCACAHALVGLGIVGGGIAGMAAGVASVVKLLHGH